MSIAARIASILAATPRIVVLDAPTYEAFLRERSKPADTQSGFTMIVNGQTIEVRCGYNQPAEIVAL